jgi:hypothetical protein
MIFAMYFLIYFLASAEFIGGDAQSQNIEFDCKQCIERFSNIYCLAVVDLSRQCAIFLRSIRTGCGARVDESSRLSKQS